MSDISDFENFEQILRENLTPYTPVNLDILRPTTKIKTPKDLDVQGKFIIETLSDKSKWCSKVILLL